MSARRWVPEVLLYLALFFALAWCVSLLAGVWAARAFFATALLTWFTFRVLRWGKQGVRK